MPAHSPARRAAKRLLRPLLNDRVYGLVQAISIARDIRAGAFVEAEMDLVPSALLPGETALDIGANLGMYLPVLSRAVGRDGHVYAFEPIPYTVATLRRVVRLLRLRNVTINAQGCSERAGHMTFTVPLQESGALMTGQAHIADRDDDHSGKEAQVRWQRTTTIDAEVVALDDCLPQLAEVSLIKCDIEGGELHAFRGAAELIALNHPTVICEINPWFLDGLGIRLAELTGFFAAKGYSLYSYDDARRRLDRVTDLDQVVEDNYVFLHPDKRSRLSGFLRGE